MMPAPDDPRNVTVIQVSPTETPRPAPQPGLYQPTEDEEFGMYLLSLRAFLLSPAPVPESQEAKVKRLESQNRLLLGLIERRLTLMKIPYSSREL